MIEPKAVTLAAGEKQRFTPAGKKFQITPSIGSMDADGVYTADRFIPIGRTVIVTCSEFPGETATITLSSETTWMAVVVLYWLVLIPCVIWEIRDAWPAPTAPESFLVSPPAATLKSGDKLRFYATANTAITDKVTWSASGGGTITPAGDYVAPVLAATAPEIAVEITAKAADGNTTARAIVRVTPATSFTISPSLEVLRYGEKKTFTANPAEGAAFYRMQGSEGELDPSKPVYSAPPKESGTRQAVITASAGAYVASARVLIADAFPPAANLARMLWFAGLIGAAGALIGTIRSYVNYVGARSFRASWGLYYILHPVFGGGLAALVYAGFPIVVTSAGSGGANWDAVMKVVFYSGLVGLFSDIALEKLRDLICTLFGVRDRRPDKMQQTASTIAAFPATITSTIASAAGRRIALFGSGFPAAIDATIDGSARTVTVHDTRERIDVLLDPATDVAGKTVTLILIDRATGARSAAMQIPIV